MIRYAVSTGSLTGVFTPELAAAFRRSKIRNIEFCLCYLELPEKAYEQSRRIAADLLKEDIIRIQSLHLPFCGYGTVWDPSALEEEQRKTAVKNICEILELYGKMGLTGPLVTLHGSNEPPLSEHPRRLVQTCRTIEDILPVTRKYGITICVELLPRTCIGHNVEELQKIVSHFDPEDVGICLDVNHGMDRYRELPDAIRSLAPHLKSFHICDYDGVDETHWFAGQGIIDWPAVMKAIRSINHDVVLISETQYMLGGRCHNRDMDPYYTLKQTEDCFWFLENCDEIVERRKNFALPGN